MSGSVGACLTCGAALSGPYCSQCGEQAVHADGLAVRHLFHDFWHEVTHVDGRIAGSFLALLFRPGQLTRDYWEGRRGRWLRPLRIFLIVTALSLGLAPDAAGPLGMRVWAREGKNGTELTVGTRPQPSESTATPQGPAQAKIQLDRAIEPAKLDQLTQKIHKVYKVIQYLSLALFAAASLLLGRAVQPYYGAHLIFALHYYSFEYVLTGVVSKLGVNPLVPLTLGVLYLAVALWRLTGKGRTSSKRAGLDGGSLVRAMLLTGVVAVAELVLMSIAAALALW